MANHVPMLSKLLLNTCQRTRTSKENTVKNSKILCIDTIISLCVKFFCCSHARSSLHSSQEFNQIVACILRHHSHSACGQMAHQGK